MKRQHDYLVSVKWTGNSGRGTSNYRAFERSYVIAAENKVGILGSSDPSFRGDKTRYNPEELLVASLSSCHMLWYLHLSAEAGIIVVDYSDKAQGTMIETAEGGGRFAEVVLSPEVTVAEMSMVEGAYDLHQKASECCFIANSVNFRVEHQPVIDVQRF